MNAYRSSGAGVAAVSAVLVLALAACSPRGADAAGARFDREAASSPVLSAVRQADPAFYARLRQSVVEQEAAGANMEAMRQAVYRATRAYIGEQMRHVATAPSEAQAAAFTAERDLLVALQGVDVEACADAAMGREASRNAQTNDRLGGVYAQVLTERLEAANAGRGAQHQHEVSSPEDVEALRAGMVAEGLSPALADAVLDGSITVMEPQAMCDATVTFTQQVLAQPQARRERLIATVFQALAAQAGG